MITMADLDDVPPPKDWKELRKWDHDLRAPIEAEYAAAVAPARRKKADALADVERDYAARLRDAKAELRAAQKTYRDTATALAKWRRATTAAAEAEYVGTQRPAGVRRRQKLAPIDAWWHEQRDRLEREGVPYS